MGDEQKEIVRTESFWIDTWLRSQYNEIDIRYIIHDATAREVDQETFYHTRESGGTLISSAYGSATKFWKKTIQQATGTSTPCIFPTATTGREKTPSFA